MELSKRLSAVAGLVTEGASVADIGTDHGYIPIYLAGKDGSRKLIAMDINEGPLKRAKAHIQAEGYEEVIETRLSDGLEALKPGEVHTMIAAGMGGGLVIHILEAQPEVTAGIREFILQPQSEIGKVRRYLETHGFVIVKEDMVEEDGKYYPMMKVLHGQEQRPATKIELLYGRKLLEERHPVLLQYLRREQQLKTRIQDALRAQNTGRAKQRIQELEDELTLIKEALDRCQKF